MEAICKYSGLTKSQIAARNMRSEIAYYKAIGDTAFATRLERDALPELEAAAALSISPRSSLDGLL